MKTLKVKKVDIWPMNGDPQLTQVFIDDVKVENLLALQLNIAYGEIPTITLTMAAEKINILDSLNDVTVIEEVSNE